MQFLPWTRRGLAAEVSHLDDGGPIPAHASLPVTVTVSGTDTSAEVQTYGPGDVTGLDTASIIRTAPGRYAMNVAPDEFVAVEFDVPDLPWMFTPAVAGANERLRPWLVVIVVRKMDGVRIRVPATGPLPVLSIEEPAVPIEELPNLADSWAWAHTQVLTASVSDDAASALRGPAHHRLSRIVCPRRLEPHASYYAALVPAFDLGVEAGFGLTPTAEVANPAWDTGALGASLSLPVYYHWEFTTGPAGDFESLARKLRPVPIPQGVGESPMYIGDAHPALPLLDSSAAVLTMEGALRAPESGAGTELGTEYRPWIDALTGIVDATAGAVTGGTAADAESVGPPIYGQWHVNRHSVPARGRQPRWLRDLNADPRHRAAAGLGAEVVRAFQEEYVDAAWRQVGDVMAANRLLALSRAMAAIAERVHRRHIASLDAVRAVHLVDQARHRMLIDGISLDRVMRDTITLPGATERMFRRMASPRNPALRRAAIRAGVGLSPRGSVTIEGLLGLTDGSLRPDLGLMPDGIATCAAPEVAARLPRNRLTPELSALEAELDRRARDLVPDVHTGVAIPGDLPQTGVFTGTHVAELLAASGLTTSVFEQTAELRRITARSRLGGEPLLGVVAVGGDLTPLFLRGDGKPVAALDGTRVPLASPTIPPGTGVMAPRTRAEIGRTRLRRPTAVAISSTDVKRRGIRFTPGTNIPAVGALHEAIEAGAIDFSPIIEAAGTGLTEADGVLVSTMLTDARVVTSFIAAFSALREAQVMLGTILQPAADPPALDADAVRQAIIDETQPRPLIQARVAACISANGVPIAGVLAVGGVGRIEVFQQEPIAPVMVGPVLDRPLYLDLARYDQERFLPGAGAIPDNAISLLETNPRFVEAFLVGTNQEFNRELLWRRYPTDRRGTAFRKFWDRIDHGDDIAPIHTWPAQSRLGSMGRGDVDGSVVLLVRGQLLRRYPNTVVYAVAATADRRIDPGAAPIQPVFAGVLLPDIAFVGFDFDVDAATAGHGTIFVLQEQPAEPRFGLDAVTGAEAGRPPAAWSDLSWDHVGVDPGGFLGFDAFGGPVERPLTPAARSVRATFGRDAGQFAAITFQRPFRVAVHASEILS